MNKVVVVTGFHPAGYEQYGKKALESFDHFWPEGVDLLVYSETKVPTRGTCISRWQPNGLREFIERNKDVPEHCGTKPVPGWSGKYVRQGYNFRFDAVRFCWQLFYPEDAASQLDDGVVMVWLDGDVVTVAEANTSSLGAAIQGFDLCHLGRITTQSELGFWAVRLNSETRKFLFDMAELYRTDKVFDLPQWHSGYVFDHCLKTFRGKANNLTPNGRANVFIHSPVGKFAVHLKGPLKDDLSEVERIAKTITA